MSPPGNPDLSGLARLAQMRDGDLRPLLFLSQVELFATAPRRDPASITTFETLALGFIPLLDRDTLMQAVRQLDAVPDTPSRVLALLAERLSPPAPKDDPAQAADPGDYPDGHRLAALVESARNRRDLARDLLARPEPTIFDRAVLYRFADTPQREAIRRELGRRLPTRSGGRAAVAAELRIRVLALGNGREAALMLAGLGIGPAREAAASGLADPAEQEIFALALVALGLAPEECVPFFLTLDPAVARSVEAIFRLVAIARSTPPQVAAYLADPDNRALAPEIAARHVPAHHPAGTFARPGTQVRAEADPARRGRAGGDLADHRAKATTNRDRN